MSVGPDTGDVEPERRQRKRVVALVLIIVGVLVLGSALAQPIKAQAGQVLLSRTFDQRRAAPDAEQAVAANWRPWPWADVAPIAELNFPSVNERRVVLDSASGEALAWGVGHVPGTAPLGSPGSAAVAGHRDGRFEILGGLNEGDAVELTTIDGQVTRYIVDERVVVDSRQVQLPAVHTGPGELILTTCWPIDGLFSGPERLLIRAHPAP